MKRFIEILKKVEVTAGPRSHFSSVVGSKPHGSKNNYDSYPSSKKDGTTPHPSVGEKICSLPKCEEKNCEVEKCDPKGPYFTRTCGNVSHSPKVWDRLTKVETNIFDKKGNRIYAFISDGKGPKLPAKEFVEDDHLSTQLKGSAEIIDEILPKGQK